MRVSQTAEGQKHILLDPGEHYVTDENVIISTLLGSCVAACVYDPVHRIMGMNHFLLSTRRYPKKKPLVTSDAGRYGIHAMALVIDGMVELGASRNYLKAKAFGGASVLGGDCSNSFYCIGEVNSRFIREFLDKEDIPLLNSDLEGNSCRVIRFFGSDFSVYVRKIKKSESREIFDRDQKLWDRNMKEAELRCTDINPW